MLISMEIRVSVIENYENVYIIFKIWLKIGFMCGTQFY